jgi:hypothetical protein
MKNIELYVHSRDGVDPKLVQTSEESTITELLEIIVTAGGLGGKVEEEILVFTEDCDEPVERHRKLSECEIRHRHHIHCHRCRKVLVSVFYNGAHQESFAPATTVKRVLKWAIKAFKLSPADAADKILVLKGHGTEELPLDAHIGSFTQPHHCSVELCLTAPVEVQG